MGERRLTFRGGRAMALVPFAIFIIITIGLSFANFQDINAMVAAGVIALLIGMLFSKDLDRYWDVILKGLGSKVAMTAVMLWLVVGMYGAILKSGHIVEGLVWVSVKLGVSGAVFTVCAFVFSALFAVATGSGFGTISTMCFILYPAGILLGCNPAVLAGAILSGAAFGDNFAPVSDTTIIAATSQEYKYTNGAASIGGTVKCRYKYVFIAAIIAAVLFFVFGGSGNTLDPTEAVSDATRIVTFDTYIGSYYSGCKRSKYLCQSWNRKHSGDCDRIGRKAFQTERSDLHQRRRNQWNDHKWSIRYV